MKSNHTPGKWFFSPATPGKGHEVRVADPKNKRYSNLVCMGSNYPTEAAQAEAEANMRLIAKVPEMLELIAELTAKLNETIDNDPTASERVQPSILTRAEEFLTRL